MSELEFLSPDRARPEAGFEPIYRSPLERALRDAPAGVRDLSRSGKLEVRGDLDGAGMPGGAEVVRLTPHRALVLCRPEELHSLGAELRERFDSVVDLTGALAGLQVQGEQLLRRLTDLDLAALPAAGEVARVRAIVLRDGEDFQLFFPQEYGTYVVEVVLDALRGLA